VAKRDQDEASGTHPVKKAGAGAAVAFAWIIGLGVVGATGWLVMQSMQVDSPTLAAQKAPARECPPKVSVPARAQGMPVDDLAGVRPGFSARDVEETLKCISEDYQFTSQDTSRTTPGQARQAYATMKATRGGGETYTFALFGPPGQERVGLLWRDAVFDVGAGPTVQSVEGELTTHFGPPHESSNQQAGQRLLSWSFSPEGKPIRKTVVEGSPTYIQDMAERVLTGLTQAGCLRNAKIDPDQSPVWDMRCGITVRAEIEPQLSDKTRAARIRVAVADQQGMMRIAPAFRAPGSPQPPAPPAQSQTQPAKK
jgi:hypothetical protein